MRFSFFATNHRTVANRANSSNPFGSLVLGYQVEEEEEPLQI